MYVKRYSISMMKSNIVTAFYCVGSICFLLGTLLNRFMPEE